jgi:hypothetical protein
MAAPTKAAVRHLIAIWSRASFCEWIAYGAANPDLKHRECYREFQKLPQHWQEALWPIGYGRWHAEFADEEMEAANG